MKISGLEAIIGGGPYTHTINVPGHSAEAIVRALADCEPVRMTEHGDRLACGLCDGEVLEGPSTGTEQLHDFDCPWRLAVEWVAMQDADDPSPQQEDAVWTPEAGKT